MTDYFLISGQLKEVEGFLNELSDKFYVWKISIGRILSFNVCEINFNGYNGT